MFAWLLGLLACASDDLASLPAELTPAFASEAEPITCAARTEAPLLDEALEDAGLTASEVGYTSESWQAASYADFLDDRFRLPWFREVHWDPLALQCHTGQLAVDLDHGFHTGHPVAMALGEAMDRIGVTPEAQPLGYLEQDVADLSDLPEDLQVALAPILMAMSAAAAARDALVQAAPEEASLLVESGHGGVVLDVVSAPNLLDEDVQKWVKRPKGPRSLFDPARVLAFAIENADLERFAGLSGVTGEVRSPLGPLRFAGPGDDAPGDIADVALYLDFGGNDTYVHDAGASSARVPVSVHLDLGGDDHYGYVETAAALEGMLPDDAGGRYPGDDNVGPVSLSRTGRQGSGRFGIGMLFDFGGDDTYRSLKMSQGYGHLGVGVLYDGAGDDVYQLESAGQGAGIMGLGLLIDAEGVDRYSTFAHSQGFGGPQGVGIAYDGEGDDTWFADPGRTSDGGIPLYYSAQIPGDSNASLSQGASTGIRNDSRRLFLSGGLGVLRDRTGDDTYVASVFGQGTGYWQGAGYLLDGSGADRYDALWYVQGGAAHYAIGALMDDGPQGDFLNQSLTPVNVHVGSGHDFSVGLYVNQGGDDEVRLAGLAAGASNCQGIGIAVDNDGSDVWEATHPRSFGLGNQSTECNDAARTQAPSVGLFLDSGGDNDAYAFPNEDRTPADNRRFGHQQHGANDEFGGAVDGDGATALHASGVLPQ